MVKNNIRNSILTVALLILFSTVHLYAYQADSTATGSIQLSSSINKTETPLNHPVELTVTLSWEGRPNRYKVAPFENPNLTNLEIAGSSTNSRSEIIDGSIHTIKDFTFRLYPVEIGMAYVDEIVISWTDSLNSVNDNLVTNRMSIKVVQPVYETDYSWIWTVLISGAVLGVVCWAAIGFMRKRKGRTVDAGPPPKPLEDQVLEEITALTAGMVGSYKKPLDQLVSAFRRYLIERFKIAEGSRSDSGIITTLESHDVDSVVLEKVRTIFDRAEQLRFSGADVQPDQYEFIRGHVESCITACRNMASGSELASPDD